MIEYNIGNTFKEIYMKSFSYLNKYMKRYKNQFFVALTFLILETMGDLIQPTLMAKIIDKGVKLGDMSYVVKIGGLMFLMTILGATFAIIRNIVSSRVSQSFGADLREDLYIKIQGFSFDNVDEFQDASLITRLTNDVNQIQNFSHGLMRIFVKAPVLGIGATVMAFILNPKMALILLAIVPIVVVIIYFNLKVSYPIFTNIQESLDKVNGVMREYLAGIRVVKAFNRYTYEKSRFKNVNEDLKDITLKGMRTVAIFSPMIAFTVNIGIVLVLWLGGYSVNSGNMEVGKVIAFVNYMTQVLFSLSIMSRLLNIFIRSKASSDRIKEVFDEENTILRSESPETIKNPKGQLEFQDVSFKYNGSRRYILEDINFRINPGEILAIIGSTGSGKTTLINLIPRFYDVNKGRIIIDGKNIANLRPDQLREQIALVPQKTLLFTGSIKDNIKWGNSEASDEEVETVAKISQADDFITSFNEGYNTYLGQGGLNLSGGQKQRISIARALIKKPSILILDDSTSSVDLITERKIKAGLKDYLKNTTTILIAQRITSVMDADKILVMDRGKIVGLGNHEELMKDNEVYQDIYNSQIGKGVDIYAT